MSTALLVNPNGIVRLRRPSPLTATTLLAEMSSYARRGQFRRREALTSAWIPHGQPQTPALSQSGPDSVDKQQKRTRR